jgi:tRNA A37 threonylcarbamoyladenosine synthetase subunit TsaC/SUA5/YrdC/predicted O-methyltransferase YrrM
VSWGDELDRAVAAGGLAVFPADTVYGIACDPLNPFAVERLYLLKRRERSKPCAVMFFDLELAFEALPELGPRTREALSALMPGGVSVLLPNPSGRFPLACGDDPSTLGLRVISGGARGPLLQSSANRAGGPDPRSVLDVPELIRAAADVVIDGGPLPGTPSTVVDLRDYEDEGSWSVVREGAVAEDALGVALGGQFHFDPGSYASMIRGDIPVFDELQEQVVAVSGAGTVTRILELGTGTGETARRLLARHPKADLVGIDASGSMLAAATRALPGDRVELVVGRLEHALPARPFDLVASVLAVHHLTDASKADLFRRVRSVLSPGGRFVLGDVVVPVDRADALTSLTPGFDRPSTVADQLGWLADAGFNASVRWQHGDLVVIVAEAVYRRSR